MNLGSLSTILLLLVLSAICVINCEPEKNNGLTASVDRHDIHRIILKPEKSKKNRKRPKTPKSPKHKPFRPNQQIGSSSFEDSVYEPTAHASNTRYQKQRHQRPYYPNHHDEYHDLIKPKPPRHEDATPYSYPEEESHYQESSNQQNYVPYLQNSGGQLNANDNTQADVFIDWNPIPSTQLTHNDYSPPPTRDQSSSATTNNKRNKRKRKAKKARTTTTTTYRPVVIFMTSTTTPTPLPTFTQPTQARPLTVYREQLAYNNPAHSPPPAPPVAQAMRMKPRAPLHQQHHYVNYNHNNKSHIRYEVSGNARPKGVALPPPQLHVAPPAPHTIQQLPQLIPSPRYTHTATNIQPVVQPIQPEYQTIHHNSDTKSSFSNLDNSYEVFERTKDYNKQIKQTSFKGSLVPQPVYPQLQPFLPPTVSSYTIVAKSTLKPAAATSQLDFGRKQVSHQVGQIPNIGFGKLFLGGVN